MKIKGDNIPGLFLTALALLLTVSNHSQELIYQNSTTGAASYEVEVIGDYLYVGAGNTLQVYLAPVDSMPPYERIWEHRFGSTIDDIVVVGDVMYMAANHDGVWKIDVSQPEAPETVWNWNSLSFDHAAYDISVKGDSLFIANKLSISLVRDTGENYDYITDFAQQDDPYARIRGSDVFGESIAFTLATILPSLDSSVEGVYFYDTETLTQTTFHHESFGDHEDVIFSDDGEELYVLGGTESSSSFNINGLFYALDVTDLQAIEVLFADTLLATPIFAIGSAMNAVVENDTIYLATQAAEDSIPFPWNPANGNVYVYDAVDPGNIHPIGILDAGLWHFDLAKKGDIIHIASEWYGVRTVEVSNFPVETTLGDTPSGGWNTGSDVHGNWLAVANEGYGIKLFGISNPMDPILIDEHINIQNGFCMHVDFSADGQYLFGSYFLEQDGFRVFDVSTMEQVASLEPFTGYERTAVWQDHFVSLHGGTVRHIDVEDPLSPELVELDALSGHDFTITESGVACFASVNAVEFYDLEVGFSTTLDAQAGEVFGAIAARSDTVYLYSSTQGIVRIAVPDAASPQVIDSYPTNLGAPKFMAANEDGLYLGYQEEGIYGLNLQNFDATAYYRTSLEFYLPDLWGLQDLRAFEGLVMVAEYFGQTSLLLSSSPITEIGSAKEYEFSVYPNPFEDWLKISVETPVRGTLVNLQGQAVASFSLREGENILHLMEVSSGLYILRLEGLSAPAILIKS